MKESAIEKIVSDYAREKGWLCYKFVSPASRGVPDRIYMRDGTMHFIEFKAPGGRLTTLQRKRIADIQFAGFHVYVVESVELGKALFNED